MAPGVYNQALGESYPLSMNPGVSVLGAGYTTTLIWGDVANPAVLFPRTEVFTESTSLSGFKIANGFSGVTVEGRAVDYPAPVIENNWITGNDRGIYSDLLDDQGDASIIRRNLIEGNITHGIFGFPRREGARFDLHIDGNRIEGNGRDGIHCYAYSSTGGSAYCSPRIAGNVISGNASDGVGCKTGAGGRCDVVVIHNVMSGNQEWGLYRERVGVYDRISYPRMLNNLIYGNGAGGILLITYSSEMKDNATLVNNTIADNQAYGVRLGLPIIVNCIVWGHVDDLDAAAGQVSYSDIGEAGYAGVNHNISADPQFVNPTLGDYHVLPTSPAVDAGNSGHGDLPPTDLDGDPRVLGLAVEMGADESLAYTVAIAKAVAPEGVVLPGGLLTYTLTVTNESGHSAAGVLVTDALPAETEWDGTLEASAGAAAVDSGFLTWLTTIPAGDVQTVRYRATVDVGPPAGSVITNTALASNRTGGVTETLPVTVTVGAGVDWSASRQAVDREFAAPGQQLNYLITISNTGNISATGVIVTDTLDPNVALIAASPGGVVGDGRVTWSGLTVDAGSQVVLTAAVTVNTPLPDLTAIVNQVWVVGGGAAFNLPADGATTLVYNPPQASFDGAPTVGPAPLEVTFSDSSQHATDYLWEYGDGFGSPVSATHTHTYSAAAVYTVSLRVSNPVGTDVLTRTNYITAYAPLQADFSAAPTQGVVPLVVAFSNLSTGATSYLWDYGDGITSTIATSVHTYTYETAGVFTVSLTAANAYTQDQAIRPGLVTVHRPPSVYYVDAVNGNDLTGDGSAGAPWRTVSHALSRVNSPGSEICVAAGVYDQALGESFPLTMTSGVSLLGAGYATTVLWGDGVNPVVLFPGSNAFTESTSISGFQIAYGFYGVEIGGRGDHYPSPVIENNWITENDSGVYIELLENQQDTTIIRDNLISGNINHGIFGYPKRQGAHLSTQIEGNRIEGNGRDGIHCYAYDSSGDTAYCTPTIVGNLIAGNVSDGMGCKTGIGGRCDVELIHNVITGNQEWGFFRDQHGIYNRISYPQLSNNLIYGNGDGGALFMTSGDQIKDMPTLVNNTIADNNAYGVAGGLPTVVNCIVWGHVDDLDVTVDNVSYSDVSELGYGGLNHNISEDPRFVNPAAGDYHLAASSPAIDAGFTNQPGLPANDIDGEERVMGFEVDMGADEYRQYSVFLPAITNNSDDGQILKAPGRPGRWGWRSRRRLT